MTVPSYASTLLVRRSHNQDVAEVKKLIGADEHIIDRRYGVFDVAALM
jgi:hypothetical protein